MAEEKRDEYKQDNARRVFARLAEAAELPMFTEARTKAAKRLLDALIELGEKSGIPVLRADRDELTVTVNQKKATLQHSRGRIAISVGTGTTPTCVPLTYDAVADRLCGPDGQDALVTLAEAVAGAVHP